MSDMSMLPEQRKPQPIVRPFRYLDRVDQAREVFRLARQDKTAREIAAIIGSTQGIVRKIAQGAGFSLATTQQSTWPEKSDPGILLGNHRDMWERNEDDRRSLHWERATRASRELRGLPPPVAPEPEVEEPPARLPAPRIPVFQGAPINLISSPAAKNIIHLVALRHMVSVEELTGPRRDRRMVAIRNEAIGLVYSHCPHLGLPTIGRLFGDRDHTTILNSLGRLGVKQVRRVMPARVNSPQEGGLQTLKPEEIRANQRTL